MVISSNPADINECLTLGLCRDSECVNTRGSYLCTCKPGLMLDPSRSRCVCECGWGTGAGTLAARWDPWGSRARPRAEVPPRPLPTAQRLLPNLELGPAYKTGPSPPAGQKLLLHFGFRHFLGLCSLRFSTPVPSLASFSLGDVCCLCSNIWLSRGCLCGT